MAIGWPAAHVHRVHSERAPRRNFCRLHVDPGQPPWQDETATGHVVAEFDLHTEKASTGLKSLLSESPHTPVMA